MESIKSFSLGRLIFVNFKSQHMRTPPWVKICNTATAFAVSHQIMANEASFAEAEVRSVIVPYLRCSSLSMSPPEKLTSFGKVFVSVSSSPIGRIYSLTYCRENRT